MGKFFGTYNRTLDAKNRLLLPSKLMKDVPSHLYLLRGFEGTVSLYLEETFQNYIAKLEKLSYFDPKARSFLRLALGSVIDLEVDSHSRITIPTEVKNRYHLSNEIVILGVLDHIELFDKAAYEDYLNKESDQFEEIALALDNSAKEGRE